MTTSSARTSPKAIARQLLQSRFDAVGELAEANARIDAKTEAVAKAETELHDARAAYRDKFAAAVRAGWTPAELAATGNPAERGQDTRRPRRALARGATSAATADARAQAPDPIHTHEPAATGPNQRADPMPVAGE
ncbi:MAG: hypothetical protein AB7I38_11640 [Dehalococcoidia bacterium]